MAETSLVSKLGEAAPTITAALTQEPTAGGTAPVAARPAMDMGSLPKIGAAIGGAVTGSPLGAPIGAAIGMGAEQLWKLYEKKQKAKALEKQRKAELLLRQMNSQIGNRDYLNQIGGTPEKAAALNEMKRQKALKIQERFKDISTRRGEIFATINKQGF